MNETITVLRVPTNLIAPPALEEAENRLLSRFSDLPSAGNLQNAINNPNTILLVAIAGSAPVTLDEWQNVPTESYAGTLSLLLLQTPWRTIAHVEEVIVDAGHEGKGVGKLLMQKAIEIGRAENVSMIDLTSSPSKVAAQALYEKTGFKKRETNNWRYEY